MCELSVPSVDWTRQLVSKQWIADKEITSTCESPPISTLRMCRLAPKFHCNNNKKKKKKKEKNKKKKKKKRKKRRKTI